MKLFKFAIIATLLSSFFLACSKNDSSPTQTPSQNTFEGTYKGKYGFGSDPLDYNYTLNFKSNGELQEIGQSSGSPTGKGTYTVSGNHLSGSYKMLFAPFSDYFIEATYNPETKTVTGTWGYNSGGTDGGSFSVKRQ